MHRFIDVSSNGYLNLVVLACLASVFVANWVFGIQWRVQRWTAAAVSAKCSTNTRFSRPLRPAKWGKSIDGIASGAPYRRHRRFDTTAHVQLLENVGDVMFDRFFRQVKLLANLPVGQPAAYQFENLRFADERPLIRGALDIEVSAKQLHAFAHSIHTEMPARVRHAGIEPAAIARNLDLKLPRATAYRDPLIATATVAKSVGQRFLQQTELTAKELAREIQPMEWAKKKTKTWDQDRLRH